MYSTRIHESSISRFVPEVCEAIYSSLKDIYLKTPNSPREWLKIAKEFEEIWQFPNCIGALDGKHITFRPPISAGSYYYNYKGNHSIVLLAMCDAAYKFTYYNVGINGRISDGGVFRESNLRKALDDGSLNLPPNQALPGRTSEIPFVLIADDAFPLTDRIMKPYPNRGLTDSQKIFNYRLCRARRMIENSFGILANRFRILLNPINLSPDKVEQISLACLALHNLLVSENSQPYLEMEDSHVPFSNKLNNQAGNRTTTRAHNIRNEFKNYFNSANGAVNWQDTAVRRSNM
ncbi:hypothetical protein ABEB36_010774 [Hypothenemus hampei]